MSLIETIKQDQFAARKAKDVVRASLLTTLYSEAAMKGKNAGNRDSTDDEVTAVVQKFLKGVNETIEALKFSSDVRVKVAIVEKQLLEGYLPSMATEVEVRFAIAELKAAGASNVGDIMKGLKSKFGSSLDGKMASAIAKE